MYLIVGLGNYGDKYTYTRHNVGFLFTDALARQLDTKFSQKPELQGEVAEVRDAHEKYILLKPQTYMNRSGEAIARTMAAYNIPLSNVVVVSDDSNLDFGTVRIRFGGEAGGHNGLKSVIGTSGADFWRVRVGVGGAPERVPLEAWVLGALSDEDLKGLHATFEKILRNVFTSGVHLKEETIS
jgi:PTH1 family peptidyl-tRNA hydrolase